MTPVIDLPFGSGRWRMPVPAGWRVDTAAAVSPSAIDPARAATDALARPVAGPHLRDLARPGQRVTVVVPDLTRACPTPELLPPVLDELVAGGVRHEDITVLVALGMHRRLRGGEREELLGSWATRLRVEEAQGQASNEYRDLGSLAPEETGLAEPVPARLHRATRDADLLIAIGLVEPHLYAGWSGGRKTVGIGCASAETITALHGQAVLEHPGTRLAVLEGNPLHRALEALADRAGLRFVLNVAVDGEERIVAAASGDPRAVLRHLVAQARAFVMAPVDPEPYAAVFAGAGAAKGVNLYQASRALTYIAFGPEPVVREGGWIVTPAPCPEGAGEGPAEEEFLRMMRSAPDPEGVLERLRRERFAVGAQRAFMVASAACRYRMMIAGAKDEAAVRACHLESTAGPAEAAALLASALPGDARVLVVPNAFTTLPVPRPR